MKLKPLSNEVQIKIDEAKAGVLNMESTQTAVEFGEIVALGENVKGLKVGQKIAFKAWSVDIVSIDGKRYYFINMDTNGIKATIS